MAGMVIEQTDDGTKIYPYLKDNESPSEDDVYILVTPPDRGPNAGILVVLDEIDEFNYPFNRPATQLLIDALQKAVKIAAELEGDTA